MGLFSSSKTSTSNNTQNVNKPIGFEGIDGIAIADASGINLTLTDQGAVEAAFNSFLASQDQQFALIGGAVGGSLELANRSLEANLLSQDMAFAFSAGAVGRALDEVARSNIALQSTVGQSYQLVDAALDDFQAFSAGVITHTSQVQQENLQLIVDSLEQTQEDTLAGVSQFNQAAIEKFVAASASESQQTTEKFIKFGSIVMIAVGAAVLLPPLMKGGLGFKI